MKIDEIIKSEMIYYVGTAYGCRIFAGELSAIKKHKNGNKLPDLWRGPDQTFGPGCRPHEIAVTWEVLAEIDKWAQWTDVRRHWNLPIVRS